MRPNASEARLSTSASVKVIAICRKIPHRYLNEYGTVKEKTVRSTHPITGVEGDATTTRQEAREPKSGKSKAKEMDNGRTKSEVRRNRQRGGKLMVAVISPSEYPNHPGRY